MSNAKSFIDNQPSATVLAPAVKPVAASLGTTASHDTAFSSDAQSLLQLAEQLRQRACELTAQLGLELGLRPLASEDVFVDDPDQT